MLKVALRKSSHSMDGAIVSHVPQHSESGVPIWRTRALRKRLWQKAPSVLLLGKRPRTKLDLRQRRAPDRYGT
ncbi:hypothetical protein MRX96_027242 [Rhipicephalus microplus]